MLDFINNLKVTKSSKATIEDIQTNIQKKWRNPPHQNGIAGDGYGRHVQHKDNSFMNGQKK